MTTVTLKEATVRIDEDLSSMVLVPYLEVLFDGFPGVLPVAPPCFRFSRRSDMPARKSTNVKASNTQNCKQLLSKFA